MGSHPDILPDEGFEYWADGPVCGVFHRMPWPGVWMGHYGMKRDGLGRYADPARRILVAFSAAAGADLITGWTDKNNRAALAFAKRIGFRIDGEMNTPTQTVVMTSWRP